MSKTIFTPRGDATGSFIERRKHVLCSDDHEDTRALVSLWLDLSGYEVTTASNLAETLRAQRDLAKARPLQEQVLASRRRQLGADHPDTLGAMNNLAMTLADLGDLAKARELDEQMLAALRRQLGEEHPITLTAMSNLALVLHAQGDLDKTRLLEEKVLETRRRLLGPKHSDTSLAQWNLLNTRKDLGDEAGARELEIRLGWLLDEDEAKLSADQLQIRQDLKAMMESQKKG